MTSPLRYASANPRMEYLLEGMAAEAQRQGHQHLRRACLFVRIRSTQIHLLGQDGGRVTLHLGVQALRSVQKYPLPLRSGQEAMMLEALMMRLVFYSFISSLFSLLLLLFYIFIYPIVSANFFRRWP